MKNKAFITGSGQDASFLAKFLLDKGYNVVMGVRRSSSDNLWRLDNLGIKDKVKIIDFDLLDYGNIMKIIGEGRFSEVYNLGAMSFVGDSFDQPVNTLEINCRGCLYLLEAIRVLSPKTKFYQASTSEMFGKAQETPQKETTPFYPRSPYGIAKLAAHWFVVNYREAYNLFAVSGIMFNHESELRGNEFVTKKITNYVRSMYFEKPLELGNLDAKRDWGYAGDYVEAMWLMLQQEKADDFVIATGKNHTVREFCTLAFHEMGIEIKWMDKGENEYGMDSFNMETLVVVNKKYYRPTEVDTLIGNPKKANKVLGWKPKVDFKEMITRMINF